MTSVQRVHPAKCDPTCRLKPALPWFKVSRRKKMVAQVAEAQLVESHRVVARRATRGGGEGWDASHTRLGGGRGGPPPRGGGQTEGAGASARSIAPDTAAARGS